MSIVAELGDSRIVTLPQGPVRIYDRGSGPTIVFVHGLFANAAAWRKVVPLLADSFRCITADWPFGAHRLPMTEAADLTPIGIANVIADVIEELDLREVTLVGNDGGGMLCQLVVAYRRERLQRLVLTPCDAYENFPPHMFDYLCWAAKTPGLMPVVGRALRVDAIRTSFGRSRLGFGGLSRDRVPTAVIDHYLYGLAHSAGVVRDTVKFLRAVDNRRTLDAARHFPAIAQPVLVAWAPDDLFFPFDHAQRFANDFPNARLETVANSRTWVAEDQPERVASLIADFVLA
ncbi:alpha/beta fold hydrolase [Antrihabitans sp. YC2-6]|uniref:alpha/beta fold hydrolase n=1 Tax=Antrihabitans sp. YC2-6 TaxID=2799498 RepID=UPI0018F5589E|nr:alpha/beta hydrolase [Antrihabitans sp. YC2-6]MBJ8343389.1 alpha/beta hydrolase [Antrihabitans sp. YC2-6]